MRLLTDRFIKFATAEKGQRSREFDTKERGLMFTVTGTGAKSFAFKYRLCRDRETPSP
jgi:hypothetical protein